MAAHRVIAVALTAVLAAGCGKTTLDDHDPSVSGPSWDVMHSGRVTKLDLLLVVDNSRRMKDKQDVFAASAQRWVRHLLSPRCLDPHTSAPSGEEFPCSEGVSEIDPILDVHVGVITTSLGAHGGDICAEDDEQLNDRAHLLPTVRSSLAGHPAVLRYDPLGIHGPPTDTAALNAELATQIAAAGDVGCGFEAPLEAWYRFLVDPSPPLSVVRDGAVVRTEGVDSELLEQRANFLRDDSVVAIVMLSDENDCSIRDQGDAWKVGSLDPLPRGRSACYWDAADPCCFPCDAPDAPGCLAAAQDSQCQSLMNPIEDSANLRCWDQKRRFGADWLWPVSRYADALGKPTITDRDGMPVDNPLFASGRPHSFVALTSIAGVPWQLIATEQSKTEPDVLSYRPPPVIDWKGVLSDPHMVESVEPRPGVPTWTGTDDDIVGHDHDETWDELQYACTFALPEPKPGVVASPPSIHDPLFQDPVTGAYGTTQYRAAAFPALRQLAVTAEIENGATSLASACPKTLAGDPSSSAFGYNAAFDLFLDGLKTPDVAPWICWKEPITVENGDVAQCRLLEVRPGSACDCSGAGRVPASSALLDSAVATLEDYGFCMDGGCNGYCGCELVQLTGDAAAGCRGLVSGYEPLLEPPGWCFVDEALGIGDEPYCTSGRSLRFTGYDVPASGAWLAVGCE